MATGRERALIVIVTKRSNGDRITRETAWADPRDTEELARIRLRLVKADGWDEDRVGEFAMRVLDARDESNEITTIGG